MTSNSIVTKSAAVIGTFLVLALAILAALVFTSQNTIIEEIGQKQREDATASARAFQKENRQGLADDVGMVSEIIAQIAGQFVYDLDTDGLKPVLKSFLKHPDLVAITIEEVGGEPFAATWKSATTEFAATLPGDFDFSKTELETLKVNRYGQHIGNATIYFTDANIRAKGKQLEQKQTADAASYESFLSDRLVEAHTIQGIQFGIAALLVVGVCVLLLTRLVRIPLKQVVDNLIEIADGEADLTKTLSVSTRDEIGTLGSGFNRFVGRLRDMIISTRMVTGDLAVATQNIKELTHEVSKGTQQQSDLLEDSFSSLTHIEDSARGISRHTENLVSAVEESSAATLELGATIEEIAGQMENLFGTVDSVSSSIAEMSIASQQIGDNIELLSSTTEETASAITQLDTSIKQIEERAERTNQLSATAADDAAKGKIAVDETIRGIEEIRQTVDNAGAVIQDLGSRSSAIGKILTVIDEVADQTSLLALNAAIIAAQAGEKGRSFAVVAEEIRELADRTAASTREISRIIDDLTQGTQNAIKAMTSGSKRVYQEVERSKGAATALEKIRESTMHAREEVASIVRATQEQARGSSQITASVNQVSSMLGQISSAIRQQADGTRTLARAAEEMRTIASHGKLSTNEQTKGSRQINSSMETILAMIEQINEATKSQMLRTQQVVEAISRIKGISDNTTTLSQELDQVMGSIGEQSSTLEKEISTFTV